MSKTCDCVLTGLLGEGGISQGPDPHGVLALVAVVVVTKGVSSPQGQEGMQLVIIKNYMNIFIFHK